MVSGIDKIWAADLADLSALKEENQGVNFLLLVIDTFSKYGWIIPLKDKKGETVAKALNKYLRKEGDRISYGQIREENFIIKMLRI